MVLWQNIENDIFDKYSLVMWISYLNSLKPLCSFWNQEKWHLSKTFLWLSDFALMGPFKVNLDSLSLLFRLTVAIIRKTGITDNFGLLLLLSSPQTAVAWSEIFSLCLFTCLLFVSVCLIRALSLRETWQEVAHYCSGRLAVHPLLARLGCKPTLI